VENATVLNIFPSVIEMSESDERKCHTT